MIFNGVPWFDDRGETVNAHGGCLLRDGDRYYFFGEYKTDDENKFVGFSCYSSTDLATWKFERLVLPPQDTGLLAPGRIGERPKVLRRPSDGRFIMYMHTDDSGYTDPVVGIATCETIAGEYQFQGALRTTDGELVRRWDIGTFTEGDDAYLLTHEGDIHRLSDDRLQITETVAKDIAPGGESPAMWHGDGIYFLLLSNKTSWERNDNYVMTAPSISGPWQRTGSVAPAGTQTWNSQCTFVFGLEHDDQVIPIFMGDRWSFPRQASAATYVWQPARVHDGQFTVDTLWPAWDPVTLQPIALRGAAHTANFSADDAAAALCVSVTGRRFALTGTSDERGGYAHIEVLTDVGVVHTATIDFYSKRSSTGVRWMSPLLPESDYTIRVTPLGEGSVCYNKRGDRFGSSGARVLVESILELA